MHKGITIPLRGNKTYNIKLDTVLEENSKEEKDINAAKLKDNTFNTPAALEEYINLTTKAVKEGKDRLYF